MSLRRNIIVSQQRERPSSKKNCEGFAMLFKWVLYVRNNGLCQINQLTEWPSKSMAQRQFSKKKRFGKSLWMPIGIIVNSITNACLLNALYTYKQNMQCTHVCMCVPYMVPYVRTLVPLGIYHCQIRVRDSSSKSQNLLTLVVNGLDRLAVWHTGSNPPLSLCVWGSCGLHINKIMSPDWIVR